MCINIVLRILFGIGAIFGASIVNEDGCSVQQSAVIVQQYFDIGKFSGAWFTHYATSYVFGENAWDSMSNVIVDQDDGNITHVTRGYQTSHNMCLTALIYLTTKGSDGYAGMFMGKTFSFKVVYTDYSIAVVIYCFHVETDGQCGHDKLQIEMWSRNAEPLSQAEYENLKTHIPSITCFDMDDLKHMGQGKCESPISVQPLSETGGCRMTPSTEELDTTRPNGEWQTIMGSMDGTSHPRGVSYKSIPGSDERVFYLLSSHRRGEVCSPVRVEKYQTVSPGHYLHIGLSTPLERWQLKLRTNGKAQFICFERRDGRCHRSEVQFLSENTSPVSFDSLQNFQKMIEEEFCQKYNFYIDQSVEMCEVPDLIANIVFYSDMMRFNPRPKVLQNGSKLQKPSCKLSDIPVEESKFKVSQLAGLWYELSRTYSALNQFESSVAYFEYTENSTMHSYYSGAINNKCSPAISSYTKPLIGGRWAAEMEARLDGPIEVFPWLPFKIVYYDGMYSVHYGCFNKDDSGNCFQAEASIYGRQPTIEKHVLDKIYSIFPSLCLSQKEMHDVSHTVDCSDWVKPTPATNDDHCTVYDIPHQSMVTMEQITGSWYVIRALNTDANRVYIRRDSDTFSLDIFEKHNGDCHLLYTASILTTTADTTSGDWLITKHHKNKTPIYSMKVIYTDYQEAILYECTEEDIRGECTASGTKIMILSRKRKHHSTRLSFLVSKLKLPCGDLSNLETTTVFCEERPSCLVNTISVVEDLDMTRLLGIWYKAFTTTGRDGLIKYTQDKHSNLNIDGAVSLQNGTCIEHKGVLRERSYFRNGDFLGKQLLPKETWGFFPYKVIYTDYDNVLVTYVCYNIKPDGNCDESGKRMDILSRSKSIPLEVKDDLKKYISSACIDVESLVQSADHVDCSHVLQETSQSTDNS